MTFEVHVIDDEERPLGGRCVEVYLPESFPLSAGRSQVTEYTSDDGHANFETTEGRSGEVIVYVGGENKGTFDLEDGSEFKVIV
jgi:hypothetical protein